MDMRHFKIASAALALLLAGCAQDDYLRTEGLTMTAGDAIAKNSALQIIDPWPAGVEDTSLEVPADRSDPNGDGEKPSAPATSAGGANP
jgi:hypothetical protein